VDLVLLDVATPRIHGIEAAQGVREIVPDGKIRFLSVERSPEFEKAPWYRSSRIHIHTQGGGEMQAIASNRIPPSD
jgi:hypothetical protein